MTANLILIFGLPGSGKTTMARHIATVAPAAIQLSPDSWMELSGISLRDGPARGVIEAAQFKLVGLELAKDKTVVVEWGTWTREQRDGLLDEARSNGATGEFCFLDVPLDERWRRIKNRPKNKIVSQPIERHELPGWDTYFEAPTEDEIAAWDAIAPAEPLIPADPYAKPDP